MQSEAKATGRPSASEAALAIGASDWSGSGAPFGRPKWASRTTLAPLAESSVMVGATRSMRVASVTLPSFTGTFRSTRTRTRLPATSASSSVRKAAMARSLLDGSDGLAQRHGGVGHAVGEAPFVVVPRHDAHQIALDDLGL